jgi:hypothetical protein
MHIREVVWPSAGHLSNLVDMGQPFEIERWMDISSTESIRRPPGVMSICMDVYHGPEMPFWKAA